MAAVARKRLVKRLDVRMASLHASFRCHFPTGQLFFYGQCGEGGGGQSGILASPSLCLLSDRVVGMVEKRSLWLLRSSCLLALF